MVVKLRAWLTMGNTLVRVMGHEIRKVDKDQTTLYAVLRTFHFSMKAMGSQGKMINRGLKGFVYGKHGAWIKGDEEQEDELGADPVVHLIHNKSLNNGSGLGVMKDWDVK